MNGATFKCVLLADRHHGLIEGIHGLLETTFGTVVMVTDENSLIESASRMQPAVVVADLSLARGSGFGWLGRLLGRSPASRVIVLSVHDEPTVVQSALEAGASGFVLKRAIATDLLNAVDVVLAGGRYVSPAIPLRGC
jgi:DNA-binding NarL/FixJ family response regulator